MKRYGAILGAFVLGYVLGAAPRHKEFMSEVKELKESVRVADNRLAELGYAESIVALSCLKQLNDGNIDVARQRLITPIMHYYNDYGGKPETNEYHSMLLRMIDEQAKKDVVLGQAIQGVRRAQQHRQNGPIVNSPAP